MNAVSLLTNCLNIKYTMLQGGVSVYTVYVEYTVSEHPSEGCDGHINLIYGGLTSQLTG